MAFTLAPTYTFLHMADIPVIEGVLLWISNILPLGPLQVGNKP